MQVSQAADGNLPDAENAVTGCIGSAAQHLCHIPQIGGSGHRLQVCDPLPGEDGLDDRVAALDPPLGGGLLPGGGGFGTPPGGGGGGSGLSILPPIFGGGSSGGGTDGGDGGEGGGESPPPPPPPAPVPLPAAGLLMLAALGGLAALRRFKRGARA